jgi:hypothetical protein
LIFSADNKPIFIFLLSSRTKRGGGEEIDNFSHLHGDANRLVGRRRKKRALGPSGVNATAEKCVDEESGKGQQKENHTQAIAKIIPKAEIAEVKRLETEICRLSSATLIRKSFVSRRI